jgi:hypothetical protein
MPTVTEDLDLPGGDPPANLSVTVFPAGTDGVPLPVAYHDGTVVGETVLTRRNGGIDPDGRWTVELPPVSEMTPAGMRWGVRIAGHRVEPSTRFLLTPDDPGTFEAATLLTDPPGAILDPDTAALLGDRIGAVEGHVTHTTSVHGISDTADLAYQQDVAAVADDLAVEAQTREAADLTLADALVTEATTRAGADSALDGRLAAIEALGSLATDAELIAAVAAILGDADPDGDTLGELQALINARAKTDGSNITPSVWRDVLDVLSTTALTGTFAALADLADVATSGDYDDLNGKPTLGTAAAADASDFAAAVDAVQHDGTPQVGGLVRVKSLNPVVVEHSDDPAGGGGVTDQERTWLASSRSLDWDTLTGAGNLIGSASGNGRVWQAVGAATWARNTDGASHNGTAGENGQAVLDLGTPNVEVYADLQVNSLAARTGLAFRVVAADTYLVLRTLTNGTFDLSKVVAGTTTSLASFAGNSFADGDLVRVGVTLRRDRAVLFLDGGRVAAHTFSAGDTTTFGTATRHGLAAWQANNNLYRIRNWHARRTTT